MHDLDVAGAAVHVGMDDIVPRAGQRSGAPGKMPDANPAWPDLALLADANFRNRQFMVEIMRDHRHIVPLAQQLDQIHRIGLRAAKPATETVDQEGNAQSFSHDGDPHGG